MDTVTDRNENTREKPASGLALVLLAVLVYVTLHGGFRLLASRNLGEDDPLESLLVQDLALGYRAPQPPLYDWVLWGVQQVAGTGILGFLVIKYGALLATAGFLYATAARVLKDRVWAMLCVESMALIYQIAWRYHEGFTHEVGAMVAVAATMWAFVRLVTLERTRDVLILGLAVGLGLLTELTYWLFLASLVGAAMLQPSLRARLLRPGLLPAVAIALLLVSPYLYWIATLQAPMTWVARHTSSYPANLGKGLLDALRAPLFYLAPLIVIVPLVFRGTLAAAAADLRRHPSRSGTPDLEQLVLHQALVALGLSVAGAVLFGASGYAMHRVMPLYLSSVIWLIGLAQRSSVDLVPRKWFARLALLIAVVALSARLANMFVYDPVCKICRWGVPYAGLAEEIRRQGFKPTSEALIVAADPELAGNLRAQLPAVRVAVLGLNDPPGPQGRFAPGQVAFVWPADKPWPVPATDRRIAGLLEGHSFDEGRLARVPWHHLWRPTGYRMSEWRVLVVDQRR